MRWRLAISQRTARSPRQGVRPPTFTAPEDESAGYLYICFMGKQLLRIGEYPGGTKPRPPTELIGISRSGLFDPEN